MVTHPFNLASGAFSLGVGLVCLALGSPFAGIVNLSMAALNFFIAFGGFEQ